MPSKTVSQIKIDAKQLKLNRPWHVMYRDIAKNKQVDSSTAYNFKDMFTFDNVAHLWGSYYNITSNLVLKTLPEKICFAFASTRDITNFADKSAADIDITKIPKTGYVIRYTVNIEDVDDFWAMSLTMLTGETEDFMMMFYLLKVSVAKNKQGKQFDVEFWSNTSATPAVMESYEQKIRHALAEPLTATNADGSPHKIALKINEGKCNPFAKPVYQSARRTAPVSYRPTEQVYSEFKSGKTDWKSTKPTVETKQTKPLQIKPLQTTHNTDLVHGSVKRVPVETLPTKQSASHNINFVRNQLSQLRGKPLMTKITPA
ncbi:MAG: hypothetical protein Faunusvirus22_3 [Faunusvirus sp.]|uniref:Uncharacterized protein n=1 Tax=Faunusvirus sp. TaxID=2487766 RepID=A0A3G4ZXC0_9VIRU|nr:MAG: hypothetical protein Faunusvirus22_3 [Faunusvirus sp.]